ncbi:MULTISPECIES: IS3 family transposase [unclassified Streptomyces]|uniref:IS3 family transposase n=1 Tax=unclassified Streptomyces TaxID=2593676 RepID=UPI003432E97A
MGEHRSESARHLRDERLTGHIRRIHAASGETYGARRIHHRLRSEGIAAARCTIERLMREDSLEGVIRRPRRRIALPEPSAPRPPDLVNRAVQSAMVAARAGVLRPDRRSRPRPDRR